jgi:energy-converting hydrogenase A subunit M
LNDPQFVEAARHLAQAILKSATDSDDRLQSLAQRLVSRQWRSEELSSIKSTLSDLSSYYAIHPDEAAKLVAVGESKADSTVNVAVLAAWTMLTNELMNLDEVLNK